MSRTKEDEMRRGIKMKRKIKLYIYMQQSGFDRKR